MLRRSAMVLSLALLAGACTGTGSESSDPAPAILPSIDAPDPIPTVRTGLTAGNRLLVLDATGRVLTMRPDGEEAVALTPAAGAGLRYIQPTWSPDGRMVAWTELDSTGASPVARLATAGFDGGSRTSAPTPVAGFYLAWDPTSSRVAYLGSAGPDEDVQLGVVEVGAGADPPGPLRSGQPFYFAWGPEGDRLIAHAGTDRLEQIALDGSVLRFADRPGVFQAPVWTADGKRVIYAAAGGSGQAIVASDGRGRDPRTIVDLEGDAVAFVVSPDGRRVAFQVVGGGSPTQDRVLSVVDVGGDVVPISPVPSIAFFWSPDGERLLFLRPNLQRDVVWFRWIVWDGQDFFQTPRFQPSEEFARNYLPFFNQYALSMSLWSPDGSSFAYPGTNESGETGIWVVEAVPDAEPVRVSDGVFVAWSPG